MDNPLKYKDLAGFSNPGIFSIVRITNSHFCEISQSCEIQQSGQGTTKNPNPKSATRKIPIRKNLPEKSLPEKVFQTGYEKPLDQFTLDEMKAYLSCSRCGQCGCECRFPEPDSQNTE
jgi:hypothetical protein